MVDGRVWLACVCASGWLACEVASDDGSTPAFFDVPAPAGGVGGTTAAGTLGGGGGSFGGTTSSGAGGEGIIESGTGGTTVVTIDAGIGDASGGASMGDESGGSPLPPTADYAAPGPFGTTTETNTGPGGVYTIFRPEPLGENGFLHSPVIWGPGILTSGATSYTTFLTHLASHGFVVLSINTLSGGPGAQAHIDAMHEGLDWIIAQNDAPGVYQGVIAVERAATSGYSLGATASVLAADHAAVLTAVAVHGHEPMANGEPHGPVLLWTGNGPSEIPSGPEATIAAIDGVPMVLALIEGQGHLTVIGDQLSAGGLELEVTTAWLRYWLHGDEGAKAHFSGPGCTICMPPVTLTTNAAWDAQSL